MSNQSMDARWQDVKGRCIQDGAGVTGKVLLDGIGFQLGGHTPLPVQTTVIPGSAMAAFMQTDAFGFTGYPDNI